MNVDVSPLDGEAVTKIIADMKAAPAPVLERDKKVLAIADDEKKQGAARAYFGALSLIVLVSVMAIAFCTTLRGWA